MCVLCPSKLEHAQMEPKKFQVVLVADCAPNPYWYYQGWDGEDTTSTQPDLHVTCLQQHKSNLHVVSPSNARLEKESRDREGKLEERGGARRPTTGLGRHGRDRVLTDGGKGMPLLLVAVAISNGEQAFEAFGQSCLAVCRREREGEIWLPCERDKYPVGTNWYEREIK